MALEQGLILDWFLFDNTSIRIAPPLIITKNEIADAIEKLQSILRKF
jgi:4-aminobutyrate aminotransferase-like enzyme